MHVSKAQSTTASWDRVRGRDGFAFKFTCILLAAVTNGAAWWALSSMAVYFFGQPQFPNVPAATALVTGGVTFVGLLAVSSAMR